jgi:hypothetical protein
LGVGVYFLPSLGAVLVSFNVKNFDLDLECSYGLSDGLEDVIVGAQEVKSWGLGVDCPVYICYNCFVFNRDWEGRWVIVGIIEESNEKGFDPT